MRDLERAVDAVLCMLDPERFTTVQCDSSLEQKQGIVTSMHASLNLCHRITADRR